MPSLPYASVDSPYLWYVREVQIYLTHQNEGTGPDIIIRPHTPPDVQFGLERARTGLAFSSAGGSLVWERLPVHDYQFVEAVRHVYLFAQTSPNEFQAMNLDASDFVSVRVFLDQTARGVSSGSVLPMRSVLLASDGT